ASGSRVGPAGAAARTGGGRHDLPRTSTREGEPGRVPGAERGQRTADDRAVNEGRAALEMRVRVRLRGAGLLDATGKPAATATHRRVIVDRHPIAEEANESRTWRPTIRTGRWSGIRKSRTSLWIGRRDGGTRARSRTVR